MTDVSVAEVLTELGDDVKHQILHKSATNVSVGKRSTKITFETENGLLTPGELLHGDFKNIGLVVWIDSAKYIAAFEAVKARKA